MPTVSRENMKPERVALAFLFAACVFLIGCAESRPRIVYTGETMGTSYSVQIAQELVTTDQRDSERKIAAILERLDQQMSTYQPDSELSLLNQGGLGQAQSVSPALMLVLRGAMSVWEESGGAFDPTIAPALRLWGFGAGSKAPEAVPSKASIDEALASLGFAGIALDATESTLTRVSARELDLSALAKGFAVDQVARALYAVGLRHFLVEVGGELRGAGTNQRGLPWVIGIETPGIERGKAHNAVALQERAIATSGDYRNFLELDGRRFSHTIDPRTASPVAHSLASVSVVHESTMMADAWATALNVLGPEDGFELAERLGLLAYFIVRTDSGFEVKETSAFTAYNERTLEQNAP